MGNDLKWVVVTIEKESKVYYFFYPGQPGGTNQHNFLRTHALHHFHTPRWRQARRVACTAGKVGVGHSIAAALTTTAHEGSLGDQCFRLPAPGQPYEPPTWFENKFSPPFGFETGSRIETPVTES